MAFSLCCVWVWSVGGGFGIGLNDRNRAKPANKQTPRPLEGDRGESPGIPCYSVLQIHQGQPRGTMGSEAWTSDDERALEAMVWRRKQQPLGPCCEWPRPAYGQVLERWPGGQVRRRELWAA